MQQVVTFVEKVREGKRGENKFGPYQLRVYKTAGGTYFQTFKDEVAEAVEASFGEAAEIEYTIEENGEWKNNVVKSIKPATAGSAATESASENAPSQDGENARTKYQRSKEEVRLTEAVQAASRIITAPSWDADTHPVDVDLLFQVADKISERLAAA